jgi:hypothetical protein
LPIGTPVGRYCTRRFQANALIGGDLGAQRLGGSFHLTGTDLDARQFV